jgi:hypothetical protein
MIRLIHIAPELPPTVGGVADYTALLSHRLVEVSDGAMEPVLVHAGKKPAEDIEAEFPVVDLSGQCSASALADAVRRLARETAKRAVVLLEYSGYGFAKRGAPLWLSRALSRVCGEGGAPLITIFHEISASGAVWTSAFWLSPVQRWLSRTLLRHSDAVLVNRPSGETQLSSWANSPGNVSFYPVFSNVGEPDSYRPLAERYPCAVLFGGASEKERLYSRSGALRRIFEENGIHRLVDVGPPPDSVPEMGVSHDVVGVQPSETVSQHLRNARLGFAHRRLDLLTKSGVVAAYLSHGVPPVVLPNGSVETAPVLSRRTHYATLEDAVSEPTDWDAMSRQGNDWYQNNAHSRTVAQKMLQLMDEAQETT